MVRNDDMVRAARVTGAVAAVAAVGLATAACGSDDANPADATSTTGAATSASPGASQSAGTGEYKNGTYRATGRYTSPGGQQQIGVQVTLANSTITALSVDRSQTRGTSAEYQAKFASGIDAQVIGKNIDDLDVSKVSGSSLTSGGFNDAISQIKSQARS